MHHLSSLHPPQQIAVLGLGHMGRGIALSLLRSGYNVAVWNRTPEKAKEVLDAGAKWADTPSLAAKDASVVIGMVSDDQASQQIWTGSQGAIVAMSPGSCVMECSTLSLAHVTALSALAHSKKLTYIDCPVTGWPENARAGDLTLLVGADPTSLQHMEPVLSAFSARTIHFGPIGSGTAYKLMINLMGAVQLAGLAEGLLMAERLGLDSQKVITAIETGAASSPQVRRNVRKMAQRAFGDPSFSIALRTKDAFYAMALANNIGIEANLGAAALAYFQTANRHDPGNDESSLIDTIQQL